MWNYAPMQFDDHSILYIVNEHDDGNRELEEAVRIWNDPDREPEWLGRPEHDAVITPGTRHIESIHPVLPGRARRRLRDRGDARCWTAATCSAPATASSTDWRHGMYQGPLVVQGQEVDYVRDKDRLFGLVDQVGRFVQSGGVADGAVGHGLHEFFFIGEFARYGLVGWDPLPA